MNCLYLIYFFGKYRAEDILPASDPTTESGADREVTTFAEVLDVLNQCEGTRISIDVDCIVNGKFFGTLRSERGSEFEYLSPEGGRTWGVEEYEEEMMGEL